MNAKELILDSINANSMTVGYYVAASAFGVPMQEVFDLMTNPVVTKMMEISSKDAFAKDETSILLGTMSLWQGVDVPGSSCILVAIDRIPFPRPDEPVMAARSSQADAAGGSGFMQVSMPRAALLLAQGTGRLIRSETDRGVLVVCDTRLTTMSYGRRLVRGLPEMRRLSGHAEFLSTLRQFTTDATSSMTS